jgi:hypothetical protein
MVIIIISRLFTPFTTIDVVLNVLKQFVNACMSLRWLSGCLELARPAWVLQLVISWNCPP